MRFIRFLDQGKPRYGVLNDDRVQELLGTPFGRFRVTKNSRPLEQLKLLPPCTPSKLLAAGLNYRSHLGDRPAPEHPELFLKTPSAVIGPEEAIVLPPESTRVDYEGELVAVMGRRAYRVSAEAALSHVLGYTCGNDVSARDWQNHDLQWFRAKSSDTFAPLGPCIVTGLMPEELELQTRVNGQRVQYASTSDLIFDVATLVSFASRFMTLEPGDVVYTGTPGSTSPLHPGDQVEVEISGIGLLRNHVRAG